MTTKQPDKGEIFNAAAELRGPAERAAYLDDACRDNPQLRAEIEDLLEHDQKAGSFLAAPAPGLEVTMDVSPISENPGAVIGRYKLLQKLGEGGFGVVFMAEQKQPVKRRVALKIIKPGMDTKQVIARFEAERQALAMMDHPNIAKVLDAGTTDSGRPYFVMELVKGVPITPYCDEQQLTPKERLELFIPICQAVQHAHQKGIIHRDLKPSNILVAEYDDQAVPKVIDFGVAKALHHELTEKTLFTQYGQIVGTLEYMSPEQAKLNQLDIDTRSDVYSLGVLLYELLTGSTPLTKEHLRSVAYDEMLRLIREEEPDKPSTRLSHSGESLPDISARRRTEPNKLNALIRGELDWIVMKALEKDRARRYESANGLAEDVERFLSGEAVVAHPPSPGYRLRKFVRRNKGPFAAAVALTLTLIAGIISTTLFAVDSWIARNEATALKMVADERTEEALRLKDQADRSSRESQRRAEELRRQLYDSDVTRALDAWNRGEVDFVEWILSRHIPQQAQDDLRSFVWRYLWRSCRRSRNLSTLVKQPHSVCSMTFSSDWRLMAAAHPRGPFVTVWKVGEHGAQKTLTLGKEDPDIWEHCCFAVILPKDESVVRPGDNGGFIVYSLRNKKELLIGEGTQIKCIAVSPMDGSVVTGNGDETISIWNPTTGDRINQFPTGPFIGHHGWNALALSGDGRTLVSGHADGIAKVWSLPEGKEIQRTPARFGPIRGVAISPDGKTFASTGNTVCVWDVASGEQIAELEKASVVAFSPDGKTLATLSGGRTLTLRDTSDFRLRDVIHVQSGCYDLSFSPDGDRVAVTGFSGNIDFYDLASRQESVVLQPASLTRSQSYTNVALSADKKILACINTHVLTLWHHPESPQRYRETLPTDRPVSCLAMHSNKQVIAAGSDGCVYVWDLQTRRSLPTLVADEKSSEVSAVAFSPHGRFLAAGCADGNIILWDLSNTQPLRTFPGESMRIKCLAFSPDGRSLASGSSDHKVGLWDFEEGFLRNLEGHDHIVSAVAFSPATDKCIFATASTDFSIKLWDLDESRLLTTFDEATVVDFTTFSADGRTLFAAVNNNVIIRDTALSERRWVLGSHSDRVVSLALSADETLLVSRSRDGEIRLWRADSEEKVMATKLQSR